MNCKPGIIARIKCRNSTIDNGKIVEVLRRAKPLDLYEDGRLLAPFKGLTWWVRGTDLHTGTSSGFVGGYSESAYADSALIPLSDPGDDAQDESKAWLPPVPSSTKEHA